MVYQADAGGGPLVVAMPHAGALTPEELAQRMTEAGRAAPDADPHLPRLLDFLAELEVPRIRRVYSPYVADPDRPADGGGAAGAGPCPDETADGRAIYLPGQAPGADERRSRRRDTWQAFHLGLAQLMLQAKDAHGTVALLDVQTRPQAEADLRLASGADASCAPGLRTAVAEAARPAEADGYRVASDGTGAGGFIQRSYGRPDEGTHVLQLVLARRSFLGPDGSFDPDAAARLRPHLQRMVEAARSWAAAPAAG